MLARSELDRGLALLCPKSPSELQPSFRSGTQSPTVLRPSSFQPIIPCFMISAYSFISPFLIPFPHAFHVSDICLFHVPCTRPHSKPQTPIPVLFHFASHSSCSILFPLLFLTLCLFPMTLICSLRYLYVQNFMYVSSVWNWHRLSLLNSPLSIPNFLNLLNFLNLPNLCLSKLRTRERQVAKHQSLSHVLIEPCCRPSSSTAPESLGLPCSTPSAASVLNRLQLMCYAPTPIWFLYFRGSERGWRLEWG